MKEKEIILPDGWEVKEVKGNKIILGEADKKGLPKTWEECARIVNDVELIDIDSEVEGYAIDDFDEGPIDAERKILPAGMGKSMLALCQLLVCRNAWWKSLVWTPNWEKPDEKHCIVYVGNQIGKQVKSYESCILAFPTYELRNQFLKTFRDLIEEAKELL